MATKLILRNTQNNGIADTGDGILYDMPVASFGSSSATAVVNTAASGTEIQWTSIAGGATVAWISGKSPGSFTLTTTDISIWAAESNMNANIGGRFRVFKRTAAGSVSELGGGPFNDGVEFPVTTPIEHLWVGNVTDTAFAVDDRILLRVYITNVGTMAAGFTGTLTFNAADAATGDSFFNIAETVAFVEDVAAETAFAMMLE